jgi:hypothetical protein
MHIYLYIYIHVYADVERYSFIYPYAINAFRIITLTVSNFSKISILLKKCLLTIFVYYRDNNNAFTITIAFFRKKITFMIYVSISITHTVLLFFCACLFLYIFFDNHNKNISITIGEKSN